MDTPETDTMKRVHDVISSTRRRLVLQGAIGASVRALGAITLVLVLARVAQKLAPTLVIDWAPVLVAAAPIAIALGAVWSIARAPSKLAAARVIDEHAGLRETLSSALIHEQDGSPWARALREDADTSAAKVRVSGSIPFTAPPSWRVLACAAAALAAVWYLPSRDLLGLLEQQEEQQAQESQLAQVQEEVQSAQETIERIKQETGLDLEFDESDFTDEDLLRPENAEFIEPEESLRSAVKNLTAVSDALQEKRESEEGQAHDAIKEALESIEPKDDPGAELARALANNDFQKAREELENLKQAAQDPGASAEEKRAVSEALRSLEKQLDKAAQRSEELQQQLKDAGLSEQEAQSLARDPSALEQKLEELGMSERQARDLARQAQAQQSASDATSTMSQALSQMAQGAENNDPSRAGQGAQDLSDQLSNLEQLQNEMQALDNAQQQAQDQLSALAQCETGTGGQPGDVPGQGSGVGGLRAGEGGIPNLASHNDPGVDYTLSKEHAKVRVNEGGPVIASTLVYGSQVRGESNAAFSQAAAAANAQASEAIETRRVPKRHENAVRTYFGELEKESQERTRSGTEDPEKPAPESQNSGG